jgi:hypothetical protein
MPGDLLGICRAFQNLVIGEMVMEMWKNWSESSGLAFWEYKDWKLLGGIRTILTRPNALAPSTALSRWYHYVLMIAM